MKREKIIYKLSDSIYYDTFNRAQVYKRKYREKALLFTSDNQVFKGPLKAKTEKIYTYMGAEEEEYGIVAAFSGDTYLCEEVFFDLMDLFEKKIEQNTKELALRAIWATPEGLGSRAVWDRASAELKPNTISRASVINFLESMREAGVLKGDEKTGKGGYHWIYSPAMNEAEFKQHIARTILESLMRDFPRGDREAVKKIY